MEFKVPNKIYNQNKDEDFNIIKRELVTRVNSIESYMSEGKDLRKDILNILQRLETKVYGDPKTIPPIIGLEDRLDNLEKIENGRLKQREGMIKIAVGSMTTAIGGAIIWLFIVIKEAFIKGGPH